MKGQWQNFERQLSELLDLALGTNTDVWQRFDLNEGFREYRVNR